MYKIENNRIKLTRGDTLITTIAFKRKDGTPFVPSSGDKLIFAMKRNKMIAGNTAFFDKEPLIAKEIPTDTMELRIEPEETKDLPFGMYKYDIEITMEDGVVYTPIANEDFELCPEVF